MIIEETTGCTADYLAVDGVEVEYMTKDEISHIYCKLMAHLLLREGEKNILDLLSLIEYDSFEMDEEPCEQCGDYMQTTIWRINEDASKRM